MKDIVTWKDLRRMADDALANSKPGDSWPHILDEVARAWGKNLDSLMECQRQLAEARAALWEVPLPPSPEASAWAVRHSTTLKATKDFEEQVKISNEIIAEVIEEERAAQEAK